VVFDHQAIATKPVEYWSVWRLAVTGCPAKRYLLK